jgi:hypothetical protein
MHRFCNSLSKNIDSTTKPFDFSNSELGERSLPETPQHTLGKYSTPRHQSSHSVVLITPYFFYSYKNIAYGIHKHRLTSEDMEKHRPEPPGLMSNSVSRFSCGSTKAGVALHLERNTGFERTNWRGAIPCPPPVDD